MQQQAQTELSFLPSSDPALRHVRPQGVSGVKVSVRSLAIVLIGRYMSGPKADAILARSSDPTIKKRKKKHRNEDYPSGPGESSHTGGIMLQDEDDAWKARAADDLDLDGEDSPCQLNLHAGLPS